jgi:hypothetical protein
MSTEIVIHKPPGSVALEDNAQWDHRFQIRSETSNRLYTIARNKKSGKWGCSCPAYITRRYCKHLLQGCRLTSAQIHGGHTIEDETPKTNPKRQIGRGKK